VIEVATKLKRITRKVDKEIREIEIERPFNPFCSACRHITRPRRIPNDDEIKDSKTKTKTKFAFISFDKFDPNDFEDDFIPLCGQCQEEIDTETCYQEFLSGSLKKSGIVEEGLTLKHVVENCSSVMRHLRGQAGITIRTL